MTMQTGDPRWDRIWRQLSKSSRRQALIRLTSELPEAQGRAVSRLPAEVKAAHAQLLTRIILARKARGWSQTELAAKVGMSQPAVARIEAGQHIPTLTTLLKIVNALELQLRLG